MFPFYDARGNSYFVATPEELRQFAELPPTAAEAVQAYERWAPQAIQRVCTNPNNTPSDSDLYLSNGMLVGPFPAEDGFALIIVNTDGSLAERSGNGLTIFSQFLVDTGRQDRNRGFVVYIYHDRAKPLRVTIDPTEQAGRQGFWVDMGTPTFGPDAVEATRAEVDHSQLNGRETSRVFVLEQVDREWTSSQFVNVGNPHCVTFVGSSNSLAALDARADSLIADLTAIAFSSQSGSSRGAGRPCKHGINLQWAVVLSPEEIEARVFERGEGWTRSSGSSATAVASAAHHLGLVTASTVRVAMPGGVAPVRFEESHEHSNRVMLFGEAKRATPST